MRQIQASDSPLSIHSLPTGQNIRRVDELDMGSATTATGIGLAARQIPSRRRPQLDIVLSANGLRGAFHPKYDIQIKSECGSPSLGRDFQ